MSLKAALKQLDDEVRAENIDSISASVIARILVAYELKDE